MWSYCKPCPGTFSTARSWFGNTRITEDLWNSTRPRVFVMFVRSHERWEPFQGGQMDMRKLLQKLSQLMLDIAWLFRQLMKRTGEHSVCSASLPRNHQQHQHSPHGMLLSDAMPICALETESGILSPEMKGLIACITILSQEKRWEKMRKDEKRWEKIRKDEKEQHVFKFLGSFLASFQASLALIPMALQILEKILIRYPVTRKHLLVSTFVSPWK